MTERLQVYKCMICGNIVIVVHSGVGQLVCCGQPMKLMEENTVDASYEKHIPIIEKVEGGVKVKVGSIPHPMTEEHFIEWIELKVDEKVYREFLKPGDVPEVFFCVEGDNFIAREYCNLHGLWKG